MEAKKEKNQPVEWNNIFSKYQSGRALIHQENTFESTTQ